MTRNAQSGQEQGSTVFPIESFNPCPDSDDEEEEWEVDYWYQPSEGEDNGDQQIEKESAGDGDGDGGQQTGHVEEKAGSAGHTRTPVSEPATHAHTHARNGEDTGSNMDFDVSDTASSDDSDVVF